MKYKIMITVILFIFSVIYFKNSIQFIRSNDKLMKILKEKQDIYNIKPVNAVITNQTIIPGINGKSINLDKSYNNMKSINEFKESLLVFDIIKPDKNIKDHYDKVIVSGNPKINQISVITDFDNKYCYTDILTIKKECILSGKYTILIHKINNNYLTNIKDILRNGIIVYLESIKEDDFNTLIKYIKNNNYNIVPIDTIISEM